MTVRALDDRMRAAWRSYLWRVSDDGRTRTTLQLARDPGRWVVGVEVLPDWDTLTVTLRLGVLALTLTRGPSR